MREVIPWSPALVTMLIFDYTNRASGRDGKWNP
jgi:hypothetical protein